MRLASEYFQPERRGHKSDYYSLDDTFNYAVIFIGLLLYQENMLTLMVI